MWTLHAIPINKEQGLHYILLLYTEIVVLGTSMVITGKFHNTDVYFLHGSVKCVSKGNTRLFHYQSRN